MERYHNMIAMLFLACTLLVMGCESRETSLVSAQEDQSPKASDLDKVKKETKEAVEATKDYTYAQKREFVKKMRSGLAETERELNRLSAKVERSGTAAKAEAEAKLQALHEKAAELKKQLDDVKSATEFSWEDVKAGFRKSEGELNESFAQARQWLSEKIAP